ncbi:hypothetical protein FDW83_09615 [Pseudarthrobacter sp. NamE2]|uniref:hypothetical protein n=1 Tax=Pseudarthrobacter sp. NamE2 TaxID=2576838 RepID=UPI0010FD7F51|nr:hypothetical protein [Pseudarthrobacter sp. NamE2]TLM83697.1 hypothetical protein FDW83_09615 [Pseudarthrobacter sp. NamE2]
MSDDPDPDPRGPSPQQRRDAAPTTQQMRTVGERRRDAEQKLNQHLDEARHQNEQSPDDPAPAAGRAFGGEVGAADIAAIQSDDSITPADRVDLIANQAIPETESKDIRTDKGDT